MIEDVSNGLSWVLAHVADFGGDPGNVVITGQSAGAHLLSMLLLQRCVAEVQGLEDGTCTGIAGRSWCLQDLRGFVGVSGAYDLPAVNAHLSSRWVSDRLMPHFCPEGNLVAWSPVQFLEGAEWRAA